MATKKIDEKKTLKYAVAFYFCTSGKINFMLGNKMYQHINTVYDQREDGRGFNTCEVVYNYKAQKYEVLNVDTEIGNKEIQILYLQPIITQYFIDNKSEIWLLFLIAHSKR